MLSKAKRLRIPGAMHLFECAGQLLMNMETKNKKTLMETIVGTNQESQSLNGLNSCEEGDGFESGGGDLPCTLISSMGDSLVDDRSMALAQSILREETYVVDQGKVVKWGLSLSLFVNFLRECKEWRLMVVAGKLWYNIRV